ncbi:hypothetical protein M5W68_13710 [Paenibacillus larvae]|uniref:hypothetical protein n=1 Tax=Paenibacillus larvae TaxID=1464 RepID=UPI002282AE4F|nr:hypothetical protein [Paenibacillus larvae]MCY9526135.1 hypothetical protein [Paenibacillus larvae]
MKKGTGIVLLLLVFLLFLGGCTLQEEYDESGRRKESHYLKLTDKDYYAVIPYYVQDGTIKGFNERQMGQTEKITYIANNVILLIVDKTTKE